MVDYVQTASGLVVPASFAAGEPAAPPAGEVATSLDGRDITRGYVDAMPLLQPEDHVLRYRGGNDYAVYDEVLRDEQVKAAFDQRRLAVVSREWEVVPGGDRPIDTQAADSIKAMLDGVNDYTKDAPTEAVAPLRGWDGTCDKMLNGLMLGFAVGECMWARDGREVVLDGVKVRKPTRFGWAPGGGLRLKTMRDPNGERLPHRKFWTYAVGAMNDDDPYGLGLAHWLYWPVFFKRNGIRFWLIFLEKFGQPTAKGTYPGGATAQERQKLLAALQAIQTDSAVVLPQGMDAELIEAARSGTADYTALYDRMNQAIAKVIVGQTQTIEAAGGQYKSEVQMDVRQDLVKADSDLLSESFNRGPARWLTDWNYPDAAYPRVYRRIDDEPDLKPQADRDKIIFDMGFEPSEQYINNTYGGEWKKKPAGQPTAAPGGRPPPAFAEGEPAAAYERTQLDRLGQASQPTIDGWLERVRALLDEVSSLDELGERIAELYPELDTADLADVMGDALSAASLAGRADLLDEIGSA